MRCGRCGRTFRGIYDRSTRSWRPLDLLWVRCVLRAEVRRVSCPECGVVAEEVPWARAGSRFTRGFEDTCVWLARSAPKVVVAQLMRVDAAGAELRAVAAVPTASTAAQLARRLRPSYLRAAEAALAGAGERLDTELGRDPSEPVTLDFDSTMVEVYGRKKPGASRVHTGQLAYQPLLGVWAERGRTLLSELLSGSDSTRRDDTLALVRRTLALLPSGHGHVGARFDAGFYRIELLRMLRRRGVSISISVPRSSAMWRALDGIDGADWASAIDFPDAEVAEAAYAPTGWEHEPLRLVVRRVAFGAEGLASGLVVSDYGGINLSQQRAAAGTTSRWVERCLPTTRHALRSDTPNRSRNTTTVVRRRFGVRRFPPPNP